VRASRYLSGELYKQVRQSADFNEYVARLILEHPNATDDELVEALNAWTALALFYMGGFNILRGHSSVMT
jgi:hypothetical protein